LFGGELSGVSRPKEDGANERAFILRRVAVAATVSGWALLLEQFDQFIDR
jgi:hypothetical protein